MDIKVISGDKDGGDLRRTMRQNPYHIRCDGFKDNEEIQIGIDNCHKGKIYNFPGNAKRWEMIFKWGKGQHN